MVILLVDAPTAASGMIELRRQDDDARRASQPGAIVLHLA
jgi:hypothetical protein